MSDRKKRTLTTIIVMAAVTGIIIILYSYISNRSNPTEKEASEVENLLNKDLELYYPATPKEVVKFLSDTWKVLYTDLEDKEVDALALKMRKLYDSEFLEKNPKDKYFKDLYSEIAEWRKEKRVVSNYLFDKKQKETSKKDGRQYAVINVSYTITQKGKFSKKCKFVLRKDTDDKWKILGWSFDDGK
jgi:hypothetical protein